jgi:Kef-type K+ transport system membrane component KefB
MFGAALLADLCVGPPHTAHGQSTEAASAVNHSLEEPAAPESSGTSTAAPAAEHADGHEQGHTDPVSPLLMAVIIVLFLAKLGGDLVERIGMPAVLGELIVGIVLGNLDLLTGWSGLDFLTAPAPDGVGDPYSAGAGLKTLASIGVILLLFEVGLESSVQQMMTVGASSMVVAVLGVIAPMVLGYAVCLLLIPDSGWHVHAFIGATLCATSVGITARVLKDLGRSQQRESQIILGAAVIDDVLGLVVLAIVSGVIQQGAEFNPLSLVGIVGKSLGFLVGAVVLGSIIFARPMFLAASYLRGHGLLVVTSLVVCFGFSWLASQMGLATIVGAFAAGLILERAQYRELGQRENVELEEALRPLSAVLVPIFFVQMGIMVDLSSFQDPSVWGLAAGITIMAILGKQVCAFGVLEKGLDRLAVGLGMIPRGEVGLIFAAEGAKLKVGGEPVVNAGAYSAVVVMVMITTMVTPPLLKWALNRRRAGSGDDSPNPWTTADPGTQEARVTV